MQRTWLKKLRGNLTKTEVAKATGIKRQYYSMIENGVRNPSVEVAKKIADFLKFEWTLFFEENSNKSLLKSEQKPSA
ncbi:helix-turn-helix transcriptional regulator [Aneurinibacillus migulanus]|uniref:helix-turn-helix transcriptional regulator n=1 Tax=Aneurinibacillus migulanus TaxID=47500 RepID=UPI003B972B14